MKPALLLGLVAACLLFTSCAAGAGSLIGLGAGASWVIVFILVLFLLPILGIEWYGTYKLLTMLSNPIVIVVTIVIFIYLLRKR